MPLKHESCRNSTAWKIVSSIKNVSPFLPREFKIRRVYFRDPKIVFKSSMLPLLRCSILLDGQYPCKSQYEKGEAGEISNLRFLDVHEVFQPPVLLGVPKVKLDLDRFAIPARSVPGGG